MIDLSKLTAAQMAGFEAAVKGYVFAVGGDSARKAACLRAGWQPVNGHVLRALEALGLVSWVRDVPAARVTYRSARGCRHATTRETIPMHATPDAIMAWAASRVAALRAAARVEAGWRP